MSKSTNAVLLLVLIFWTGLIGAADYFICDFTMRQYLAGHFAATTGRIVFTDTKDLRWRTIRNGLNFRYLYSVDGHKYPAWRHRYDDLVMRWNPAVEKNPPPSRITVYYNPKHPNEAVLSPGVSGSDLLLLLLAVPVNAMIALLWGEVIRRACQKWSLRKNGGARLVRRAEAMRIRLAEVSAPEAGLCTLAASALICAVLVVARSGFAPSARWMEAVWLGVWASALGAFCWRALGNASGKYDLVIDRRAGAISLPRTRERQGVLTLPMAGLIGVSIQKRLTPSRSGIYRSYIPSLTFEEEGSGLFKAKLAGWGWNEQRARALALWLSQQMEVPFTGAEEEIGS